MGDLDWLPPRSRKWIDEAVQAVVNALGDDVASVALVGAAVHPERVDRAQGPELLVVVESASVDALHRLSRAIQPSMKHGVRLRIVTKRELVASADVFAVELAEYQAHHILLHGHDCVSDIAIDDVDLRRSVEHNLRGLGRRVRNRVLTGLGTEGRRDNVTRALGDGIARFALVARHALAVLGVEPPASEAGLLEAAAKRANVSATVLVEALSTLRAGRSLEDPLRTVSQLLAVLDPLTDEVDAL